MTVLSGMGWRMNAGVLGLSLATVSLGVSATNSNKQADDLETNRRLLETLAFAVVAARVTKSWYPIALPVAYLAYDYYWCDQWGKTPAVGNTKMRVM
jgi:hypothetical protein